MYYYLIFVIALPALIYVDYLCYKKKMLRVLEGQPDYEANRANYTALLERMCIAQKRTSKIACAVLCLAALVLGIAYIFGTSQALYL